MNEYETHLQNIRSLTKAQMNTLGRIAINEDTNLYHKKTLKRLMELNLVVEFERTIGSNWPRVTVKFYHVPIQVHRAWCEICAEMDDGSDI